MKNSDYVQFSDTDVVGQAASISFDAATFEIWGALLSGGQLVGLNKEDILTPEGLAKDLRNNHITTLFLTASLFNLIAKDSPDTFSGMKQLLVGGEALNPHWIRKILKNRGPQRLINGYGPTETTTFAAWYDIKVVEEEEISIPIGRPLSNMHLHVLDRWDQPVPIGISGELHIGGIGLARGYLNQPELTQQAFYEHPE